MLSFMENNQVNAVQTKRAPAAVKKEEASVSKSTIGLIEEVKSNNKNTQYFWNNDKIVKVIEKNPLLQKEKIWEFSYDKAGLTAQVIVTEDKNIKIIKYSYDEANQLSEVFINQQRITVKRNKANLQLTKLLSGSEQYNFLLPSSQNNSMDLLSLYEQALVVLTKIEVSN